MRIKALAACIFSGFLWYAAIVVLVALLRGFGIHIAGVWPLPQ